MIEGNSVCRKVCQCNMFDTIEKIHSEASLLDKVARVGYLRGQYAKLSQMAREMEVYFRVKKTMTSYERTQAQHLIEMLTEVQAEGIQAQQELGKEVLKGIVAELLRRL